MIIQDEVLFTLNEAVSPGRLGYNYNNNNNNNNINNNRENGRVGSTPNTVPISASVPASISGNNENESQQGSNSPNGPMAVWKKLECTGCLPSPRWCHSSIIQGNDMIVFGGWSYERSVGVSTGSNFLNDLYVLNIITLVWTKVSTHGCLPRPRCQCACFLYQKKEEKMISNNSNKNNINNNNSYNDHNEFNGKIKKKAAISNNRFDKLFDEKTNSMGDSEKQITTIVAYGSFLFNFTVEFIMIIITIIIIIIIFIITIIIINIIFITSITYHFYFFFLI